MSIADEAKREDELDALRQALRREQRARAKAEQRTADVVEAIRQAVTDAVLTIGRADPVPSPPRDRRRGREVALLHLTDWQLGKRTPSYDIDVCEARISQAVRATVKLTEIQRADHPVKECVVMLGGDLVEGVNIFPGQSWEVEAGAFVQMRRASALIESALLTLLGAFERVTVHEVWGNHGRIGKKRDEVPREDNLDRIVGEWARIGLRGQDRLVWPEPEPAWHRLVEVGEYRALLFHGDQIKGFAGLPAFAIARRVTSWATGVLPNFHDAYMGHWHQEMTITLANGGRVYMTPSTESGSQFASEFVGALGRPGQRLHFIDPTRARVTARYSLYLD